MSWITQLFSHPPESESVLNGAIERAVNMVEPRLQQISDYRMHYRKPVAHALAYAADLAARVPGPVEVNRESYARDVLVHALFPSADFVTDAFCTSRALHDYYHQNPGTDELYALMGMRRVEKTQFGIELSGDFIQHDVMQSAVYFTSHTIENPATSEQQARSRVALNFFDSLVTKVKKRVETRRQEHQSKLLEKDMLVARLRAADVSARPALEAEFAKMIAGIQIEAGLPDLSSYQADFEAVLLNPELYLRLTQTPIILDRMGIRRDSAETGQADQVLFSELIDYDRRNWTVTMVHCSQLHNVSLENRLEKSYRHLAL
ncbi:MAG: hypothetical protein A2342_05215 [Gallionellales bacterium RIFOXYB12_FULL_54_9]|nr:MAG: hypothetical protein A2342_05215 [Gallionellales bacterium RIFOXYB12_FULL_54_9]